MSMATMELKEKTAFFSLLAASHRSREIPESADLYGWLIGSWGLDVLHYAGADLAARGIKGEAHFAWVLEGRAIQDVWIMPRPLDRTDDLPKANNMYGTTLRVWDPAIDAWHITWVNPVRDHWEQQIARRSGSDIVQLGNRPDGTTTRWMYTAINPDSFHWTGEVLQADGKTWKLEGEFRARRMR
jgi:hypothetical protein